MRLLPHNDQLSSFMLMAYTLILQSTILIDCHMIHSIPPKDKEEAGFKKIEDQSNWTLIVISVFATLTALMMYLSFDQRGWSTSAIIFEVILVLVCFCLILTSINQRTFWWAPRVIAFIIFAIYLTYLVNGLLEKPFAIPDSRATDNTINALLGFCFFGLPSLLYSLSGSKLGSIANKTDISEVTPSDIRYFKIAQAARFVFLIVSTIVMIAVVTKTVFSL